MNNKFFNKIYILNEKKSLSINYNQIKFKKILEFLEKV